MHEGQTAVYVTLDTRNRLQQVTSHMNEFALREGLRKRATGPIVSYADVLEALLAYVDEDDLADRLQGLGLK
jgi:hypothetical protein